MPINYCWLCVVLAALQTFGSSTAHLRAINYEAELLFNPLSPPLTSITYIQAIVFFSLPRLN